MTDHSRTVRAGRRPGPNLRPRHHSLPDPAVRLTEIARVLRKVQPKKRDDLVLKALAELSAAA